MPLLEKAGSKSSGLLVQPTVTVSFTVVEVLELSPPELEVLELSLTELEELLSVELLQAARLRTIARAMISATSFFFISFPP
jgi:hypothetical protein